MTEDFSRRRLFGLTGVAAAGAAGLSVEGCSALSKIAGSAPKPTLATTTADASAGFVTQPHLTPPQITVKQYAGLGKDSNYIFLNAPFSGPGHGGTIILNSKGQLVWFGPNTPTEHRLDFNVQSYQGKQVLTWWQGLVTEGYGRGEGVIADSSYNIIKTVKCVGDGVEADLHEFNLTSRGTAYLSAYKTIGGVDLSPVHGPSNGYLLSGVAQEIDIATGKVVWQWDSHKNGVDLWETYETLGPGDGGYGTAARPFNYFHINSIADYDDEHVLISGRNTWCVYLVRKADKKIIWRLNGKRNTVHSSDSRTRFYWQHHVRAHSGNLLTVFDNGAAPAQETHSRGLVLQLEVKKNAVALRKEYIHPGAVYLAGAMGSAQLLGDGMFVGWGTVPAFSQFDSAGKLVLDGTIVKGDASYRAFTLPWSGHPTEKPAAAARHNGSGAIVYASWNGATGVAKWRVFAGKTAGTLKDIGTANRTGFETAVTVRNTGPWFAAQALDPGGHAMAESNPVKIA